MNRPPSCVGVDSSLDKTARFSQYQAGQPCKGDTRYCSRQPIGHGSRAPWYYVLLLLDLKSAEASMSFQHVDYCWVGLSLNAVPDTVLLAGRHKLTWPVSALVVCSGTNAKQAPQRRRHVGPGNTQMYDQDTKRHQDRSQDLRNLRSVDAWCGTPGDVL